MGIISSWLERNWNLEDRATRNAALEELVGYAPQETVGIMAPGNDPRGAGVGTLPGAGFLGGDITDPYRQAAYAGNLMQIPGMAQGGMTSMENVFTGGRQLGWNREQLAANQAFDTQQNQILAAANASEFGTEQTNRLSIADASNVQSGLNTAATVAGSMARQKQGQQFDLTNPDPSDALFRGYTDRDQYNAAANRLYDDAVRANTGRRGAIELINRSTDVASRVGGLQNMTGADDMNLIRALIKANNPTEAIMQGDIDAARVAAGGYPGWIGSLAEQLKGDGTLSLGQRQELMTSLQGTGASLNQEYQAVRDEFGRRALRQNIDPLDAQPVELMLKELDEALMNEKAIEVDEIPDDAVPVT